MFTEIEGKANITWVMVVAGEDYSKERKTSKSSA